MSSSAAVTPTIHWGRAGSWSSDLVGRWLSGLSRALPDFDAATVRRGQDRLDGVGPLRVQSEDRVHATVEGSGGAEYAVALRLDLEDDEPYVGGDCDCPLDDPGCKHIWAACVRLQEALRAPGIAKAPAPSAAFTALDRLLAPRPESGDEATRLQVRVHAAGRKVGVTLHEQVRRADGSWTPGRELQPRQLQGYNYASGRTSSAVRALVRAFDGALGYRTLDPTVILDAMAGREDAVVVWANDPARSVRIARLDVALQLIVESDEVRLVPSLGGDEVHAVQGGPPGRYGADDEVPATDQTVAVLARDGGSLILGRVPARAVPLVRHLSATPLRLPRTALGELAARLGAIERVLPVAVPDELVSGPPRDADRRVRLLLEPRSHDAGDGVRVSVRVRPLDRPELALAPGVEPDAARTARPDPGPAQLPGDGATELLASGATGLERVRRDLPAELASAAAAVAALGLTGRPTTSAWTWQVDLGGAIALIDLAATVPALVVEWPASSKLRVSRELGASSLRVTIGAQRDWFGVEGSLEVDGERVALASVLSALKSDGALVALGDGRLLRLSADLRRRLEALQAAVRPRRDRLEVDATAAPLLDHALDGLEHVELADTWCAVLRRLEAARTVSVKLPPGLRADLRGYQREGWAWLKRLSTWGAGACLADDMGLGKTVQAIALLLDRAALGPALVVAPLTVGPNWLRELARFAPSLRAHAHRETERDAATVEALGPNDVLVVSYELARIDADVLGRVEWGTLVLDEAQRIKNATTKTAHALGGLKAGWRLALTGTPVENHLGDLWSLFRNVSPGLLGSWDAFRTHYAHPIETDKDAGRRAALAQLVRPFLLRRTKGEVLKDLPARSEVRIEVDLSDAERTLYDDARLLALSNLEGAGESARFLVLAALTRLRQLACHPRLVDAGWRGGSAKLAAFLEVVREAREGGHRALVFSQFTQHLALLREALDQDQVPYAYLDGGTPARERQRRVDAFQAGEGDLFLISLKAGGTGLNLTGADVVIHMDPWWNPSVEDQATDRAHRIGQTKPVTVYRIITRGTIEEQILALHADKRDLVAGVLDGTDRAGKLSTDELVDLIRRGDAPAGYVKRPSKQVEAAKIKRITLAAPVRPETVGDDVTSPTALAELRATLRLTPEQAGARVGVTAQSWRNWEAGRNAPSPALQARLLKLAAELRAPIRLPSPPAPVLDAPGIAALRESLGLTRAQLGELVGASAATVGGWERGAAAPKQSMLDRLRGLRSAPPKDLGKSTAVARRAAR